MNSINVKRFISSLLVVLMTSAGIQASAHAGFVQTDQLAGQVNTDLQREELRELFSREEVSKQLATLGVDPADAMQRVDSLTDAEVAQLHSDMEELPAGAGALGTIAIVLLILILLDVAGVTDIFPKI